MLQVEEYKDKEMPPGKGWTYAQREEVWYRFKKATPLPGNRREHKPRKEKEKPGYSWLWLVVWLVFVAWVLWKIWQ